MKLPVSDCLINARWVVPIIPSGVVLHHHSLVIRNGRIGAILPTDRSSDEHRSLTRVELPHHLVTAGLINAHGHAAMTLLRGYADDLELDDWLNNHIWPVEGRVVDKSFVYDGSMLAVAEMISTGTTCAADTYFFPPATADAFSDAGFRGQIGIPVVQFGNAWAETELHHIEKGLEFHDSMKHHDLITTAFSPHAPYTVSDAGFNSIRQHADALDIPVHLHLHETRNETEHSRPLQRIQSLGLLSSRLQAIHMTQLTTSEIDLLARYDVNVVHCPESNMKLASGICPVLALGESGVNVALGTDGAASNNNLDMLEEARSAALLSKVSTRDATGISAVDALEMATINGARLLGLESEIGSLEPGKSADLIAVDFSGIGFQPVYHPISQLIYVASGAHVSHTWINGQCLYQDRRFTHLDVGALRTRVEAWREKIKAES